MTNPTKWLILILLIFFSSFYLESSAQVRLTQLLKSLESQHPLAQQAGIIAELSDLQQTNLKTQWYPQAAINAQATIQSEVTALKLNIPGMSFGSLPKDQYKITLDATQTIYDGKVTKSQSQLIESNKEISTQKSVVEQYQLKQQVISNYMNVLLLDKKLKIFDLSLTELQETLNKMEALYKNHFVIQSAVTQVKSLIISTQQKQIESQYSRKQLIQSLSELCGTPIDEKEIFNSENPTLSSSSSRPELHLFEIQKQNLKDQWTLTLSKNRPKVSLFGQGGYGRPGLNMLASKFEFYAIGGLKLTYPLSHFYTLKNDEQSIHVQEKMIDNQKEIWQKNNTILQNQFTIEIEKINQLLLLDDTNIDYLEQILKVAKVQLKENTILLDDFTKKVNDLETARINKSIHEIQLLFNQYNLLFNSGNL